MSDDLLLDTCVLVFSSTGVKMSEDGLNVLEEALGADTAFVSPISAWEIGRAMSLGRIASPLSPLEFYRRFVGLDGVEQCDMPPEVLVSSSYLPGELHRDPMDRILVATAREYDMTILTRDRAILDYAAAGHVKALAC